MPLARQLVQHFIYDFVAVSTLQPVESFVVITKPPINGAVTQLKHVLFQFFCATPPAAFCASHLHFFEVSGDKDAHVLAL